MPSVARRKSRAFPWRAATTSAFAGNLTFDSRAVALQFANLTPPCPRDQLIPPQTAREPLVLLVSLPQQCDKVLLRQTLKGRHPEAGPACGREMGFDTNPT